jgi:urease accessory protein
VKASARIVAVADGMGGSRLAVLTGEAPLLPRRTGPRRTSTGGAGAGGAGAGGAGAGGVGTGGVGEAGEPVEVHLVGGAAGPLRGDDLRVEIEVGPGANLCVRTIAATIVLGGRSPQPSRMVVRASVAAGGRLCWLPEPIIATAGCDHIAESQVDLTAAARLTWREELVCGRSGEQPGDLRLVTTVRLDGRALSCQELAVGPSAPGWAGPAVLGGHRAAGSLLVVDPVGPPAPAHTPVTGGARSAVLSLAGPAVLVTAVAPDAYQLRRALGF